MEDHEREQTSPINDDHLQLTLSLRPGPPPPPPHPLWRNFPTEFDFNAKREEQTMRRREARRKREEKRKLRAAVEDKKRRRKAAFPVTDAPCYMVMPDLVRSESGRVGFQPYSATDGPKLVVSSPGASDHRSTSQGGSSSESGTHSSHSHHLDRSDPTTSNVKGEASPSQTQTLKPTPSTEVQSEASPSKKASPTQPSNGALLASRPPKPPAQQTNEAPSLVSQMPYVSTTGNGPNGKTITGFLYKYNQSEVCIVCVCHGSSLTPAGFVEHAGGVDVDNPLRHITVVPFAFT